MSEDAKTIGCEQALRQLFEYLDRELNADHRADMERHLKICRSCYSRAEFERRLKERLSDLGKERAPEALVLRVGGLMRQFTGSRK